MNQVYSLEQLRAKKRPQLWAICETLGLPKHASNDKCIEAIFAIQPVKVEVAPVEEAITIKSVNDAEVVYVGESAIASIEYDDEDRSPYVVLVGGVEFRRFKTQSHAVNTTVWHYKNGTLPAIQPQLQPSETQPEEISDAVPVINKRAREIEVGDRIIYANKQWKVQKIGRERINFQAYHSVIDGVCYRFMLLPVDYQYQEYKWCDRSSESNDWQDYWIHHDKETARLRDAVKWLNPLSEAEFVLAA